MKELGRKGGKASGGVKPEQVPASLREELRNLDPKVVRAAIEETLAGANQSAKVSAVKLLADVDAFKQGDECPRCARVEGRGARRGGEGRPDDLAPSRECNAKRVRPPSDRGPSYP
jgi:hypothetical protein